jgi:hypothetical protein
MLQYYNHSEKLPKLSFWFRVVGPLFSAGTVPVDECLKMLHESFAATLHHPYGDVNKWHQPEHPSRYDRDVTAYISTSFPQPVASTQKIS